MILVPDIMKREDVSPLISVDLPRASCSRTNPSIWETIWGEIIQKNIYNYIYFMTYMNPLHQTHKPESLNMELKPPHLIYSLIENYNR